MRLTLFDSRQNASAPPNGNFRSVTSGEAGAEGEQYVRMLIGGGPDINPELTGRSKHLVFDEMRRTSASIKSMLMFFNLTVRSAVWSLDPREEDPLDRLITDFVAWNLGLNGEDGQLDLSWGGLINQGLGSGILPFGVCLEEKVWWSDGAQVVRPWRDADGDEHLLRPLAKLAPRPASSIFHVEYNPDGTFKWVKQSIAGTDQIPGDKLVHTVFEPAPGAWDGISLLRPVWGVWTLQKLLLISTGIGWDRYSSGLPVVWHPDTTAGEETAKTIGQNIRSHQRAYAHFPVPPGGTKADSEWALEILSAASSIADPSTLLRWCSEQIAEAGMQHFSRQGMGQTGARAAAETQAEPFYMAAQSLAEDFARERARQVIRHIVLVNFGEDAAEYHSPKLTVSKLRARNIAVIANAIAQLEPAGFTFTDRASQDDIRELLGLTKLPNDLAAQGIDRATLDAALAAAGLDATQLAAIVNALPADIGVAPNTVRGTLPAAEGAGLGL